MLERKIGLEELYINGELENLHEATKYETTVMMTKCDKTATALQSITRQQEHKFYRAIELVRRNSLPEQGAHRHWWRLAQLLRVPVAEHIEKEIGTGKHSSSS